MIWKRTLALSQLNAMCQESAVSHLGIKFCELGADFLEAKLTVDTKTRQPFGMLHGGVSAALAETVASMASLLTCYDTQAPAGIELNISHLQAVKKGEVFAKATPLHLGKSQQVWQIDIVDEQKLLIAVARCTLRLLNMPNQG